MLKFSNKQLQSIEFKDGTRFRLFKVDGIDSAPIDNRMQEFGFLDGAIDQGTRLEPREITIEFGIFARNKEELLELKRLVTNVFNAKLGLGTLIHSRYGVARKIEAKLDRGPTFPGGGDNETETFQRGMLSLICPDPYFKNAEGESRTDIATWIPNMYFPIGITDEGRALGYRTVSLFVNVENKGHETAGIVIMFRATGTVVNPSLRDVNTQKYIKLNYTMQAGEVITITTHQNKKRVTSERKGIKTNIFNSIVHGSSFLQLAVGDNIYRYEADNNEDALNVSIYHSDRYVGV